MSVNTPSSRLLLALLELGQRDETTDLFDVSEEAGLSLYGALRGLSKLASEGFVDPGRMRLTLAGLTLAASVVAELRETGLRETGLRETELRETGRSASPTSFPASGRAA